MNEVASLENSKRLYELSNWGKIKYGDEWEGRWYWVNPENHQDYTTMDEMHSTMTSIPAYSAGYLLRKLPLFNKFAAKDAHSGEIIDVDFARLTLTVADNGQRVACYISKNNNKWYEPQYADTTEDALALLAIKLFEEGVL